MRRTASQVIRQLENRIAHLERESGLYERVKDFFVDKPRSKFPALWVENDDPGTGRRVGPHYWIATKEPRKILPMLADTKFSVKRGETEVHGGITFISVGNVSGRKTDPSTRSLTKALESTGYVYNNHSHSTWEITPDMVSEVKRLLP